MILIAYRETCFRKKSAIYETFFIHDGNKRARVCMWESNETLETISLDIILLHIPFYQRNNPRQRLLMRKIMVNVLFAIRN